MKRVLCFILFTSCFNLWSQTGILEPPKTPNLLTNSTKALLSYDHIQKSADEFVNVVKRKTLGDHSDKVLMFLPLVTGELEFNISDLNFYHRVHSEKTGVEYVHSF